MDKKRNGQILRLIIYVSLTLCGLIWMFVDMNNDKKSTTEILNEFDTQTIESSLEIEALPDKNKEEANKNTNEESINDELDSNEDHSKKTEDYHKYDASELPYVNPDEDNLAPETYDKPSSIKD